MAGSNDGEQGQAASSTGRSQRGQPAHSLTPLARCILSPIPLALAEEGRKGLDHRSGYADDQRRMRRSGEGQRTDSGAGRTAIRLVSAKRILAAPGGIPLGLLRNSIRHRALVQLALHDAAHGRAGAAAVCTVVMRCDAFGCGMLRPSARCGLRTRPG